MENKSSKGLYIPLSVLRLVFFLILFLVLIWGGALLYQRLHSYYLRERGPESALEFYLAERDFIEQHVLDELNGGYYYWVEKDGHVKDSRKYSLFQANMVLWLGGLESQHPDPKNIVMLKSAADYLVDHLYKGNGEWIEYDTVNHRNRREFFWNPRSEAYISSALLQAYRLTNNEKYLLVAVETNRKQREKNPTGRIFAEFSGEDIGARFPEHTGHLEEYLITGNQAALDYVRLFDQTYRGVFAKEVLSVEPEIFFYHGTAAIDKMLYAIADNNPQAFAEGSAARNFYWSTAHDDAKSFNPEIPGESSDHGRDYYDKRLAMDILEWTYRFEPLYQEDARETWNDVKRFWDFEEPYGFLINTSETRKTCFTIGITQYLMDLTGPEITTTVNQTKSLFNHQVTLTMRDPEFQWNNIELRGIGLDGPTLDIKVPFGFDYGKPKQQLGPCEDCVTYTFNYVSLLPFKISAGARDYFGNIEYHKLNNPIGIIADLSNLNINSRWYYSIVIIALVAIIDIPILLYVFYPHRKKKK